MSKYELLEAMHRLGAIKSGDFTLKSGIKSDTYVDLRILYSEQNLLKLIATLIHDEINEHNYNLVCGVPNAGIPYAITYATTYNMPLIMARKDRKEYGLKNMIEGKFENGNHVLLIEDVMTTGASTVETIQILNDEGLVVNKILTILDRRTKNATIENHQVISLITLSDIVMYRRTFLHPLANKIWKSILYKQSNLCLSLDIASSKMNITQLNQLIKKAAKHCCMIKFHFDLIDNLNQIEYPEGLIIMNDHKCADITPIVTRQIKKDLDINIFDAITIHPLFGEKSITELNNEFPDIGLFLVAQVSTDDNLINNQDYQTKTCSLVHKLDLTGVICQARISVPSYSQEEILYLTPGVSIDDTNEHRTIEDAITRDQCDVIIVGRGIYDSNNIIETIKIYQKRGWDALCQRYK